MCGIAGIVRQAGVNHADHQALGRMTAALVHRGPDASGNFARGQLLMGMRRLAINDLAGGNQPLYSEDHNLVLIANGEIYNHRELRRRLQALGHRFSTASDCETIVHAWEQWGADSLHQLRGMFAFALVDQAKATLTLVRDRMGEKPLYLYEHAGQLLFASELRALVASGRVPMELEPTAVDDFFHYRYVPEPATLLRQVRKLPAAAMLRVDLHSGRAEQSMWWNLSDAPTLAGEPAEAIAAELDSIARLIVRADVPVGVALSGGLDSSIIAALAARHCRRPICAFSVGYPGRPPCDERDMARQLADHLGLPLCEIELDSAELVDSFEQIVSDCDDPIVDIASFGYWSIAKAARAVGVPVLLQGHGGDELFWGYSWLRRALRQTQLKDRAIRYGWAALPEHLLDGCQQISGKTAWQRARKHLCGRGLLDGLGRFQRHRREYPQRLCFYDVHPDFVQTRQQRADLYHPDFLARLDGHDAHRHFCAPRPWQRPDLQLCDLIRQTYLLENGIAQGDRLSMAHGVELRLPLVDYRLHEVVRGLRQGRRDDHLPPKHWLRQAAANWLPPWVLDRPKRGFAPPVRQWYNALFAQYGPQLCHGQLVQRGILTASAADLLAQGPQPRGTVFPLSFTALALESWCKNMSKLAAASSPVAVATRETRLSKEIAA